MPVHGPIDNLREAGAIWPTCGDSQSPQTRMLSSKEMDVYLRVVLHENEFPE